MFSFNILSFEIQYEAVFFKLDFAFVFAQKPFEIDMSLSVDKHTLIII